jgi:putative membrane protein insertion efficiency factor
VALIRWYQRHISPRLGPCCRYEPSCSRYAQGAFETHGFVRGLRLTLWRLWRCRPGFPGGYDPVPEADYFELPTFELAEDGDD